MLLDPKLEKSALSCLDDILRWENDFAVLDMATIQNLANCLLKIIYEKASDEVAFDMTKIKISLLNKVHDLSKYFLNLTLSLIYIPV